MTATQFTPALQELYRQAVANAANVAVGDVTITNMQTVQRYSISFGR